MTSAGVAELKAKLSEYLAAVERGDEVLVTDRGRPVARLVGIHGPPGVASVEEASRLERLQRSGTVRLGTGEIPDSFWNRQRPLDPDAAVRGALLHEREEAR